MTLDHTDFMASSTAIITTIFADDKKSEEALGAELIRALKGVRDVQVSSSSDTELGQVIFVQSSVKARAYLTGLGGNEKRRGRAVFLIVPENQANGEIPEELEDGLVDDVLVHPFRKLEVISKIRLYEQLLMWNEVEQMNASFSEAYDSAQRRLQVGGAASKNESADSFSRRARLQDFSALPCWDEIWRRSFRSWGVQRRWPTFGRAHRFVELRSFKCVVVHAHAGHDEIER